METSNEALNELLSKDQKRLFMQKLKALGIKEDCITTGDKIHAEFIPTGVLEVDSILGANMGIPTGTLLELCGESQSGKTFLGYKLIAQAQKLGKKCVFFNIENSFYPPRAESCGVNTSQLMLVENVGSAEKYGELIKYLLTTKEFGVMVVDSISAMIPNDELEKSLEQVQTIGIHARFVKRLVKDLTAKTAETGTIVVLINQLYMGSGAMPGSMTKQASGGNAMNYFTHMRLWINKINGAAGQVTKKDADGKDVIIGGKSKVLVMKTRYGQPGLTTEFKIMFTDDETTNLLDEFLYKAKAKGFEYIKEVRKKFIYLNEDTGEQIESKDAYEFAKLLQSCPSPTKRTKNDNSTTAFDYICGRLKISGKHYSDLLEVIEKGPQDDEDYDDLDDIENPFDENEISFEDAAKQMT
jgi:protein RecA